jgi:integrase
MKASKNERGTYAVRFRDSAGHQREKTFVKKGDAITFGHTAEADRARGVRVDPQAGRMTVATYAELWMAAQLHRPTTADPYARHLKNHIKPALGHRQLAAIRTSEIQSWVRGLSDKGPAPSSVHTIYGILRRSCAAPFAMVDCTAVRVKAFAYPSSRALRSTSWSQRKYRCWSRNSRPLYRALVVVVASAGLRHCEAFGITKDSILWLERSLRVDKQVVMVTGIGSKPVLAPPKTAASVRTVPLANHALEAVARHIELFDPPGELLFTTREGNPLRRGSFNHAIFNPALRRAGLSDAITFHDLRHSFASLVIKAGATPKGSAGVDGLRDDR